MRRQVSGALLLSSLPLLVGLALAILPHRAGAATPDLSGYWDLAIDSRKVPQAQLQPAITPAVLAQHAKADAHEIRYCVLLGMPFLMDSGRPLNIEQGAHRVLLWTEAPVAPRYIYLDRRQHIPSDEYDPTTNGDSIGHWEGDTLVVDTVGFSDTHGITAIPGGGYRTGGSHLVERFRLLEGGNVLSVVSTWMDPKVFRAPHRYEFRYYRLPAAYEPAAKDPCDPFDDTRSKFLDDPNVSAPPSAAQPAR
jgi:hypothetical protein